MEMNDHNRDSEAVSYDPARRFGIGLQVVISVLSLLAIVVMVNYLSSRHYKRWDLTQNNQHKLSPLSHRVLKSITNTLQVVVFFDKDKTQFGSIRNLLNEYQYHYPKLKIDYVDYYRDAAAAQRIRSQYKLNSDKDQDLVIFESAGAVKKVYQRELTDYDYSGIFQGKTNVARPQNFKGEQAFTSAIISVTDKRQSEALFLHGHGEHDPSAQDELGFARFAAMLEEKNIRTRPFRFGGTNSIPPDALLIIGGPRTAFAPEEIEGIETFLAGGGRMFAMLNFTTAGKRTGLERLLSKWGVEVLNDRVRDPEYHLRQDDLFAVNFSAHPVVRSLGKAGLYLLRPRTVRSVSGGGASTDGMKVDEIVRTSESGQSIEIRTEGERDPEPSKSTAIPLAVAVEKGGVTGVKADRGSTRIIVIGDSLFAGNQSIEQLANRDFLSDSVNWLLDRAYLVGEIGPRPLREYRLTLTSGQLNTLRWLLLVGLPAGVLLAGSMVWVRRSR